MIGHHKHILLIGINDIDALVSLEKHHFPPFLELMFVGRFRKSRIHKIISFLFMNRHHKHLLLIGIDDIEALVSYEKRLFLPFYDLNSFFKWIHSDLHNNLLSFKDWAPQTHSPHWDKWY